LEEREIEEKKWLIGQLVLILDMLVDEFRTYSESVSDNFDYVLDSFDFLRDEMLAALGVCITILFGFASLKAIDLALTEELVIVLILVGLAVYFFMNYVRNSVSNLLGSVTQGYVRAADRLDFFRGQFYSSSIHLDKMSLAQLYLCESFIKVLLGEAAGTIRVAFQPLLELKFGSRIRSEAGPFVSELDQLVDVGHKTYLENRDAYQSAHFSKDWLIGAEEFSKWYLTGYLKLAKMKNYEVGR
jgi:hypothetical protein